MRRRESPALKTARTIKTRNTRSDYTAPRERIAVPRLHRFNKAGEVLKWYFLVPYLVTSI